MSKDPPKLCKDCRHGEVLFDVFGVCTREQAAYFQQDLERFYGNRISEFGSEAEVCCGPSAKHFEAR